MRIDRNTGALSAVLALTLTACGSSSPATTAQDQKDTATVSASATAPGESEQITAEGIAMIVTEHLGSDAVRRFSTFTPEPGSVSVMVELRDRTPHNFAVQVYSPEQAGEFGKAGTCPPERQQGPDSRCRLLDNGTVVMTDRMPYGFSDDNADGTVVSGTSVTQDNGAGMAMYESYDDSPAVTPADMEAVLGDPRLVWLTDAAVNEAGADLPIRKRAG